MGLKWKKGDAVRQIPAKPMEGVVAKAQVIDNDVQYLVLGPGDQVRWFKEEELEAAAE